MNKPFASAKKFVKRNERRILITTALATTATALVMRAGLKQHDDFLKENGLFDAFYNQED